MNWLYQITSALSHIHNQNIIHRDIKPSNIFITKDGIVKLTNFSQSKMIISNKIIKELVGTHEYIAPEIIRNDSHSTGVDVWSLGVTAYQICAKSVPFFAPTLKELG